MAKNEKAGLHGAGSKAIDQSGGDQRLSVVNDTTFDSVKSIIDRMIQPQAKVVRLHRCFCCNRCFTARKMPVLFLCRTCVSRLDGKGIVARRNVIDKTLNNIHRFLKLRIETI